jgi:hypothetical protein
MQAHSSAGLDPLPAPVPLVARDSEGTDEDDDDDDEQHASKQALGSRKRKGTMFGLFVF